ncbi:hypothetical protein THAOC_08202, partial [Thalassiosira oceanica]
MKQDGISGEELEMALKTLRSCVGYYYPDFNNLDQQDSAQFGIVLHDIAHEDTNAPYRVQARKPLLGFESTYRFFEGWRINTRGIEQSPGRRLDKRQQRNLKDLLLADGHKIVKGATKQSGENVDPVKLKHRVNVPENLDLADFIYPDLDPGIRSEYVLCATKHHVNGESPQSGHYITIARDCCGEYYKCDDMIVTRLTNVELRQSEHLQRSVYQAYYTRKDTISGDEIEGEKDAIDDGGEDSPALELPQEFDAHPGTDRGS